MAANTWFPRSTSGYQTWAARETAPDVTVAPTRGVLRISGQQPTTQVSIPGGVYPSRGLLRLAGNPPTVSTTNLVAGDYPPWFARTTASYNTWAAITVPSTVATIDGTAELPPFALIAQAEITFTTAAAALSVSRRLAGTGSVAWTVSASLRIVIHGEPPPVIVPPPSVEVNPLPANIVPAEAAWRLVTNTSTHISPLNGKTQTIGHGGDRWAITLTYRNLRGADAAVLSAFLASLRGTLGRATLPDHAYVRRGAYTGDLAVNGSGQAGTTLACDGGTAGLTGAVMAGDWFELADRLYMIVEDADTNVSGNITLTFTPPLEESPADGAVVNLSAPTASFALVDNAVSWSRSPGGFTSFNSIDLIEDRT